MDIAGGLTIRTRDSYKSVLSRSAFSIGETICALPRGAARGSPAQHTVQIGSAQHIEVGHLAYLNHSCNPNVIVDTTRMLVIAARDVAEGDELAFFYPSTEWEMAAPFVCLCGTPRCVHVVAGARFLPLVVLEHHFLNRHVREMMIDLLDATARRVPDLAQARP